LGKVGYRSIMKNLTRTADYLSDCLEAMGFIVMSKTRGVGLPLVAFRLDPTHGHHFDEFSIAHAVRFSASLRALADTLQSSASAAGSCPPTLWRRTARSSS